MQPAVLTEPYRIGSLGSSLTFAGQATTALVSARQRYGDPTYLPTMDDVVAAVLVGSIDLGVLTSETSNTAMTDTVGRILGGEPLYIVDELLIPYHCALLGKPGTQIADISHVGGHGSIRQCGSYLRERLPHATRAMHRQNSVEAAREVLAGDGSNAVIGTLAAAEALGLEVLDTDIDRGSTAGWWALANRLIVTPNPNLIALKVEGAGALTSVFEWAQRVGFRFRTLTNAPTGTVLEYRYLVVLETTDGADVDLSLLEPYESELVGIFSSVNAA